MSYLVMSNLIYWIGGALLMVFLWGIRIVRPIERGLVERFGKYNRFATPGFNWIIPLIENMVRINITEMMVDAQSQEIITKDNLNAIVDAQVYFKVKLDEESVKSSQYNVNYYELQIVSLARTTLRNIIGTLTLKEANSERNRINKELMGTLSLETKNSGLDVVRAELKEIQPPNDVQETMNKVVKAENEKVAAVDFATAQEIDADGFKRAAIKKAEGEARAVTVKAEAQAEAIRFVNESAQKYFVGNAQRLKAYEVTQAALQKNTKYVITEKGIQPTIVIGEEIVPLKGKV